LIGVGTVARVCHQRIDVVCRLLVERVGIVAVGGRRWELRHGRSVGQQVGGGTAGIEVRATRGIATAGLPRRCGALLLVVGLGSQRCRRRRR